MKFNEIQWNSVKIQVQFHKIQVQFNEIQFQLNEKKYIQNCFWLVTGNDN